MLDNAKCKSLFANIPNILIDIFESAVYPWEIIPHISDIIYHLIETPPDGYKRIADGILVGKNVTISPSAEIIAPTIIADHTEIRHGAFLRGSVILGSGCVVGNSCEVKNSIIMNDSQIPHFNYVGDSILGAKVHLGAGAIISNLRSDKEYVQIKCENHTVKTGLRKMGAILADSVEIGCGAVLCPGTVIGHNTTVYPLTMTRGFYPACSIVKKDGSVTQKAFL